MSPNLRTGERRSSAEWLRKQLSLTRGGGTETTRNPAFDDELLVQLKQFQLAQGLVPDGVAGLKTLMRLSALTDQGAPKLLTVQDEK